MKHRGAVLRRHADLGCDHVTPQRPVLRLLARFRLPIWIGSSRRAARAPSSQNWQPWDFVVVTDREQLRELARVWRGAGHVAGSAATIVVIGPAADNEFHRAQLDLGQATMAMLLAAADLGIGSCHAVVWPTCRWPARCWASPRTATGPCSSRSATRLTAPWSRSAIRSGGRSARSSTAAAGRTRGPAFRACVPQAQTPASTRPQRARHAVPASSRPADPPPATTPTVTALFARVYQPGVIYAEVYGLYGRIRQQ